MTVEGIRTAITARLVSSWATATDICWPNLPFREKNRPWIRPIIRFGDSVIGELGEDGIGLRYGVLMISVFVPASSGTKEAGQFADRLEAAFRRKDVEGVMFKEPSTEMVGLDDNGYYHAMVKINFEAWIGE